MKRRQIGLVVTAAVLGGAVYWATTLDVRQLDTYASAWFQARGLTPPSFRCSMVSEGGSRLRDGRCNFEWPAEQLGELKTKLNLTPGVAHDPRRGCSEISGRPTSAGFVSATPPGPIYPQNSQSSFRALYLDEATGEGCLDLFYPYG